MKRVVILGAGGLAREVSDVLMACNAQRPQFEIIGFIDENPEHHGKRLNGSRILGDFSWFDMIDTTHIYAISAVGNPAIRKKLIRKALDKDVKFCNVIHPQAVVTSAIDLGVGVVISAGCILTNSIKTGSHVYLNLGCTVCHDAVLDDFCNLNPGVRISGNVHIEAGCELGTGAIVIPARTVGRWSILGAGAVVHQDVPANVTAVGVPAKVIKTREEGWHER